MPEGARGDIRNASRLRTALVHHWLVTRRGGEKVFEALFELFPHADIFTLVCDRSEFDHVARGANLHTSWLQVLPGSKRWYPYFLPLFPWATERLGLAGYDLVISSDAATLKGVRTDPRSLHICYCHTPMRYLWEGYEAYYSSWSPLVRLAHRWIGPHLRRWDYDAAQRVTHFVANSRNVAGRIRRTYDRDSTVIYPPVDTEAFSPDLSSRKSEDFFLVVSQLVPYKRVDVAVEAFNRAGKPLVVIGAGPEFARLRRCALGNVRFLGFQPDIAVQDAMKRCRALVFPGEEDFGMVMVEAQACGKPVIALGRGGACEIVTDPATGVLFEQPSVESLREALERFDRLQFDAAAIRTSALRFTRARFAQEFSTLVERLLAEWQTGGTDPTPWPYPSRMH